MMKKTMWLAVLLLLTNAGWGIFYAYQQGQQGLYDNKGTDIYTLSGNGINWRVDNYRIVVTPDNIQRGNASLTYLGNADDVTDSDYFSVHFYEPDPKFGYQTVLSKSASSQGGPVNMLLSVNKVGTITGPYEYGETVKTKQDYENTYVEMIWKDNDGKKNKETIQLQLVDHLDVSRMGAAAE
ncbi:hypothetical protein [Paenibacillus apiarius]|uniref:Secreted protein n=2 Tax=Paenibacillus apiarius TaxID=46240 RepID=A0ABT4DZ78_9BACL|nr:hypothetical protein [Paenibacillus apiarius]MCY9513059.1 hypothetical protein [Paenibacillus apiarius]MCY9521583.1 hypothetical protein [Paenibacillus apiarius]MCY9551737.1 hypothetical protein [Paenibacillus apiarius]MCY9560475.1 hypothetical protein [Paenibacillus apiarius]MCY9685275.1 hypothetical protein [Paenibacillus apiarius]